MSSDQISLLATVVTGFAALVAIGISIWQSNQTRKAITQDFRFEQAETVRHFTQSFFDFVKENGEPLPEKFKEREWAYRYWSLISTEFYFYNQGVIPPQIFASWIVDIAEFYAASQDVWKSHSRFLEFYDILHPDMIKFFIEINKLSSSGDKKQIHTQIRDFVYKFAQANNDSVIHTNSLNDLWS